MIIQIKKCLIYSKPFPNEDFIFHINLVIYGAKYIFIVWLKHFGIYHTRINVYPQCAWFSAFFLIFSNTFPYFKNNVSIHCVYQHTKTCEYVGKSFCASTNWSQTILLQKSTNLSHA